VTLLLIYLCLLVIPGQVPLRDRLENLAFALDCALFAVCTLGRSYQGESFSSSAHRARLHGKPWRLAELVIDRAWLVFFGERSHCEQAYLRNPINSLPPEQRCASHNNTNNHNAEETTHG